MTTEEIDKAAEKYTESLKSIAFENLSGEETPYLLRGAFKEGLESANKHWQEKTRWIPVEERLPELRKEPYCVLIKWEEANDENIDIVYIFGQREIDYMLWVKCKYWKEIE